MDINLNILFVNHDNCIEQTKINANKETLIGKSEYFRSLLTSGFNETDKNELNIDLTHLKYNPSLKHINVFFNLQLHDYKYKSTNKRNIKLIMDTESDDGTKFEHHMEIDYGLTKEIPIHEFYIMLTLCDYFSCDEFKKRILKYMIQYKEIFGGNNLSNDFEDNEENQYVEEYDPSLTETFKIYLNTLSDIDTIILSTDLTNYTYSMVANNFIQNIYYNYLTYKQAEKLSEFKNLLNIIKSLMKRNNRSTKIVPRTKIEPIELSIDEIKQFSLEDCYELIARTDDLVTTDTFIFKVYDFYDVLNYEKNNQYLFKLNKKINLDYKIGQKCIKPKDEVLKLFKEKTKGLFDNMKWDNVILTGGFIFGLLNDLTASLISSTDIDLFTYNDQTEETAKYLLNHFNQFKPYYSVRGHVTTIIIPTFPYDIQIIPTSHSTAYDVIHAFDFSYVKTYYDGNDIYTTFDGLLSLKYATTNCSPTDEDNSVSNSRLYKTLLKGLSIQYNPEIKNDFIDDDTIDFEKMEQNEEIQMMLNKPGAIRKLANHLTGVEMLPLIKTYYMSGQVTMNLDNLHALPEKEKDNSDDYDNFSKNVIAYSEIEELIPSGQTREINYLSFKLDDNRILRSVAFETGYCKTIKIFDNEHFGKDEIVFLINSDIKNVYIPLSELRNAIDPLWNSYPVRAPRNTGKTSCRFTSLYDPNEEEEEDNSDLQESYNVLKIYLSKKSKAYKKYEKEILRIQNGESANLKCLASMWYWNKNQKIEAHMKFNLESIEFPGKKTNKANPGVKPKIKANKQSSMLSDYNGA